MVATPPFSLCEKGWGRRGFSLRPTSPLPLQVERELNGGYRNLSTYNFIQLDVFTDQPFCGNPLAVFPEAEGINNEQMQQIAREMNLSETVFVLPSEKEGALRKLRIFT